MITDWKTYSSEGKTISDEHSPNYQLSGTSLCAMIRECGMMGGMLEEFYIGIACGYRMAKRDAMRDKKQKKSDNKGQIRDKMK